MKTATRPRTCCDCGKPVPPGSLLRCKCDACDRLASRLFELWHAISNRPSGFLTPAREERLRRRAAAGLPLFPPEEDATRED